MKAFIPTPIQEKLLKASLWKGEDGLRHFYEWKKAVDFQDNEYPSTRLIPLLYKNLLSQNGNDPLMPRLKGVYRYSWANNQNILSQMPKVIRIFEENKIPCLFVKGCGLTLLSYDGDMGVRMMTDLDVFVHETDAWKACDLLEKSGWKSDAVSKNKFNRFQHAGHFKLPTGVDLDLHWHLLARRPDYKYDLFFWENPTQTQFQNQNILTLCPTDHLIHTCLHGAMWEEVKTIRWISDAYTLIEKHNIDWNRFLSMATKLEFVLPLRDMLEYLKRNFKANIPEPVLEELKKIQSPLWQHKEYEFFNKPTGFLGMIPLLWIRSTAAMESENFFRKIPVFLKYLKSWYDVESYSHMMKLLIRKTKNKILKKKI